MRLGTALALAGALLLSPLAAMAQEAAPACASTDAALPGEFSGWSPRTALRSAVGAPGLATATLHPGQGVEADLHPTPEVTYLVQPEKPGGSVSRGGIFEFSVDRAGVYAVALGSGAWIDVLKDKTPVVSTAHGHGPACSTIRKVVDFPLQPGRYVIQVSASAAPKLAIMVARRP
jgi:hypothetical protein